MIPCSECAKVFKENDACIIVVPDKLSSDDRAVPVTVFHERCAPNSEDISQGN